jgi:hypothetical protein
VGLSAELGMCDAESMSGAQRPSTFVGRVGELGTLERLVAALTEGESAALLVIGEAGMGKSRLIWQLREKASSRDALIAIGRTSVEGASLPYGTIMSLLRDLGRQLLAHPEAQVLEPARELLLGGSAGAMSGPVARVALFDAVLRAVEVLASERPLVLVLEDLHWADAGSVDLLDHLVRNIEHKPLLVAVTFRPEEVEQRPPVRRVLTELRRHPLAATIELQGLSRDEIGALVADATGNAESWTLVDAVHTRSEGNPLFAEELTMADRGKARAVARNPKVSLCVLDERWPFAYLQVYADATVEHDADLVVDVMMAVGWRMSGQPLGDEARPVVEAMAAEENRVVLRCRPYATFAQPPRHLHRNDQTARVTHWVSATVPWDAPD